MKFNKIKSALLALGVLALAGAAQAQTMIYVTGSTAARAGFYAAATTTGYIFTNANASTNVLYDPAGGGSADSKIMYQGQMAGIGPVILNCSFTGSEAGIAAVAQKTLTQPLSYHASSADGNPNAASYPSTTAYALPGTPNPTFYIAAGSTATATHVADLTMADTSQTVAQTPISAAHLTDYGVIGVVPFTWMKGYTSVGNSTWTNIVNITPTTASGALTVGELYGAWNFTGVTNDIANDVTVAVVGRNLGSGTRADVFLNAGVGLFSPVLQYAWGNPTNLYPASAPGVLTFGTNNSTAYAAGQTLTCVYNDGFDGGGAVESSLNTDQSSLISSAGIILLGYLGVSDAKHALNNDNTGPGGSGAAPSSGAPTPLQWNGVYESDTAVAFGTYTLWGEEHLLGPVSPTTAQAAAGTAISTGVKNYFNAQALASGNIVSNHSQSYLIGVGTMQVHRGTLAGNGSDTGYPAQGGF